MASMTYSERLKAMLVAEIDRHAPALDADPHIGHVAVSWTRQYGKPPKVRISIEDTRTAQEWGND
jgi:hypothetical protein